MHNNVGAHRVARRKLAARNLTDGNKKYTQQELAEYLGVPRTRVSMIENGIVIPTFGEIEKIAEYLELTMGHLYTQKQIEFIMSESPARKEV